MSAARYEEEEAQHYARLVLLISDAKFLRHYVKKALQQVGRGAYSLSPVHGVPV